MLAFKALGDILSPRFQKGKIYNGEFNISDSSYIIYDNDNYPIKVEPQGLDDLFIKIDIETRRRING